LYRLQADREKQELRLKAVQHTIRLFTLKYRLAQTPNYKYTLQDKEHAPGGCPVWRCEAAQDL
jgi:hypothetical protein